MPSETISCPMPGCTGVVRTKRLEIYGLVMFCDGPEAHSETLIRNAFARWDDELDSVDPDSESELLRRVSPVEFLRDQVMRCTDRSVGRVSVPTKAMLIPPPRWPTGLGGVQSERLERYLGLTLLSGKASSGKSWSAIKSSLDAARTGWDVVYISAEAVAVIHHRLEEIAGVEGVPDTWALRYVPDGTSLGEVVQFMTGAIRTERTLFVIDSFSTLHRMTEPDGADFWQHQRMLERVLFNIRQNTAGCVGLLVLSEANAAGETKGRSFDHIADLSVNFKSSDDDHETKEIRVPKSWWSRSGTVGDYVVRPSQGGLVRVDRGESISEQRPGLYEREVTQW